MKKKEPSPIKMGVHKLTKAAAKSAEKQRGVPFKPGQSGNPRGRPAGSRNRASIAIENLLAGEAEGLARKTIELAKDGDLQALRLCLDRLCPPRKDSPVSFQLPPMVTTFDAVAAMAALAGAVASGELTPMEAGELTKIVQAFAKIVETAELEQRIRKLEEIAK